MSDKKEKFHEYDGIIELDNPLPTWWLWTFFLAIIFSGIYYLHYEIAGGPTLNDELKVAMSELEKTKTANKSNVMETEDSLKAIFEKSDLTVGEAQYTAKCQACHGPQMQGGIGPNLTDKFWLHGKGSRLDLVHAIRTGFPDKGMPPWETALKAEELYAISSYILSKKGSNPAGAKTPQGEASEGYLGADW